MGLIFVAQTLDATGVLWALRLQWRWLSGRVSGGRAAIPAPAHPGALCHGSFPVKLAEIITFGLFCHDSAIALVLLLIIWIKPVFYLKLQDR